MKHIYIGIDDTDVKESRGTGHLARTIAASLEDKFTVAGVTRHQLLFDPRVPFTAKNSSAAIILEGNLYADIEEIFSHVKGLMLADFIPGSDPGLCVCEDVPSEVTAFGNKAKTEFVYQKEALELAARFNIQLLGLGGTNDGVIGALSAVGLAAGGDDGRYVLVGNVRSLEGLVTVDQLQEAGVWQVRDLDGGVVTEGLISTHKLRPARREGKVILFVHWSEDHWEADKLD